MKFFSMESAAALTLFAASLAASSSSAFARSLEIQGHRGARGHFPENTLPGFQRAAAMGVDVLELDVGMTRDGVVIISHDSVPKPSITRWRFGGGFISRPQPPLHEMTFSRTQAYDVGEIRPGSAYAKRFPEQQSIPDTTMPPLSALLNWMKGSSLPNLRLNIEVKTDPRFPRQTAAPAEITQAVIDELIAFGLEGRSTLQSFDFRSITAARTMAPRLPLSCLTSEEVGDDTIERGKPGPGPWLGGLDVDDFGGSVPRMVKAAGCSIWSPRFEDLSPGTLSEAHAIGLRVIVWTVNDDGAIAKAVSMGVDGIISDYPDRVIRKTRP